MSNQVDVADAVAKGLAVGLVIVIVALLMALPVMWLWNAILPDVTKGAVTELNFWQALGLNFLCSILVRPHVSCKCS